ncbi:sugar ABC transporter ATP-binding protein [Buchananella hordeovulneris]|uniref:sugar ABC transporter ATP-binding protein n=1 Tax=Buchananella hordeovulneris TaxID=52770 RepID=UPI000F5F6FCE|nr:sugar ABC transporter ATP-binding protein [Buchananella hordeovulneris]RRD43414.1 sugar ABC transporter ATP-binding protein [Buchananella hordeovulneris]
MRQPDTQPRPLVEIKDLSVLFPGVRALDGVDFTLYPGQIHALMGENGAGKSTLIKALTGVYAPAGGQILLDGQPRTFRSPAEAAAAGISTVYQEVNLAGNLTVAENVMLGHEPRRGPFINWRAMRDQARQHLQRLHLDIDPGSFLAEHSLATQQLCAIARALVANARILILDEPTSSLDNDEVAELFAVLRELRDSGVAILFVSHFLEQVYEISDHMTVLRHGRNVGGGETANLPRLELVSLMIGRDAAALEALERDLHPPVDAPQTLAATDLGRRGAVAPFNFTIDAGQIVGFAGLLGSGRSEAVRLLAGADKPTSGQVQVRGTQVHLHTPLQALNQAIAYSTEDRKHGGIVGSLTVAQNLILALQAKQGIFRPLSAKQRQELVDKYLELLDIQPRNPHMLIKNLSGGNQQKVLLARWLATNPQLLILDEPTRGIDVGTKAEIQRLVVALARDGLAVIFVSSELPEVLRLSHRIVVMCDRHKIADLPNDETVTTTSLLSIIANHAGDKDAA